MGAPVCWGLVTPKLPRACHAPPVEQEEGSWKQAVTLMGDLVTPSRVRQPCLQATAFPAIRQRQVADCHVRSIKCYGSAEQVRLARLAPCKIQAAVAGRHSAFDPRLPTRRKAAAAADEATDESGLAAEELIKAGDMVRREGSRDRRACARRPSCCRRGSDPETQSPPPPQTQEPGGAGDADDAADLQAALAEHTQRMEVTQPRSPCHAAWHSMGWT